MESREQADKRRAAWDAYYKAERARIDKGWRDLELLVMFGMGGIILLIVLVAARVVFG